jgi:hypothetical protein
VPDDLDHRIQEKWKDEHMNAVAIEFNFCIFMLVI